MVKRIRTAIQWSKEKGQQFNGQKKKDSNSMVKRKRTYNDLQNIHINL
jgi:hypothetical protein